EVQRRFPRPGKRLSASIAKRRGGLWPAPTLSGSEAAAAQVAGGAAVFSQHPSLATVTTGEVGVICRRLGCCRVASGFLEAVGHAPPPRPEFAGRNPRLGCLAHWQRC